MIKAFLSIKETGRLVILLGLIGLAFSYAMFQGGFVSWFLFYSFLPFALYALVLALYPVSFTGERMFSKREAVHGEPVRVTINLERGDRFPLFYIILEEQAGESLLKGDDSQAKTMLFPGFKKELRFEYQIDQLPRGEHCFKGIRVRTCDLFGLVEKESLVPIEDKILIYPAYEEINYRPFNSQIDQGAAPASEQTHQDTSMSIGIREYQPGDRFSWINWKATAKRNEFMTKEFEARRSHDVMILMDCTPAPQFESAVSFTASLIKGIIQKGAQVGLLTVSDERKSFGIRGGEAQERELFYQLAKLRDKGSVPFGQVLREETFLCLQGHTLLIVTTQLTKGVIENAERFSSRGRSVAVFIMVGKRDPASEDDPINRGNVMKRGIHVYDVWDGQFADIFRR